MGTIIIFAIIAAIAIIYVLMGVQIVQQSETRVIERLGKYDRTLPSGINLILPIIDRPREIYTRIERSTIDGEKIAISRTTGKIDLREQVYDFPKQSVITKDNVTTTINALLYFQIVDPMKAVYEIDNLPNAIEKLTQTTLRNVIGELELDETLTSRDTINSKLRAVLDDATNKWGVKVNRVELQDITPPESVRRAMEQQMQAERERRAKVLEARGHKEAMILQSEGEKESQINQAEAEKQTQILKAQGEADAKILQASAEAAAIEKVAAAIEKSKTDPATYMLLTKYIESLKEIAAGDKTKTVYLPFEASNLMGALGSLTSLIDKNK
ncbi:MAG: paraslipin [Alistipes sp.]|jgi:regulator of protease activity HflC (stomatin/prohibitin superfamily)|nr:paraslipin [Alistipes sp.]